MTAPLTPAEREAIRDDVATLKHSLPHQSPEASEAYRRLLYQSIPALIDRLTALLQPPSDGRLAKALEIADWPENPAAPVSPEWLRVLASAYRAEHAEVERLRAIVERLPKTADGVPVTPGMTLFKRRKKHGCGCEFVIVFRDGDTVETDGHARKFGHMDGWLEHTCECYSTREAAEAAKAKGGEE